ncbi:MULTISPECIES: DUF5949 family protein [unclassified Streptomyces]|uniref:DUF5949 family protein n=1 Tax=Streptomyces sp. R33 TaxID=3238629 RepID=A0AB39Y997_9ACTN|nr:MULTISPECIES: DUF5949 family protein [unclassified Streptomyces]KJY47786.1 hypothetical protein VR46_01515 [Streptomyces sp. NRRL S-444]KOY57194.1 hypothetical protein ADK59_15030 [Streptomyces sp. XY332]THA36932.1 hypothetical protein E6W17_23100 [Streptomyces sp. A1547]
MTSTQAEIDRSQLGTLSVLAWIGDPSEGHDIPYLLAYTLGDGPQGREAGEKAARGLLEEIGLPIGDVVMDGTRNPAAFPVQIMLVDNQVALTLPGLNATCTAPAEWVAAANESGQAYFLFATRAWPEAVPGEPVAPETLQEFAGDEAVLTGSAHCVLAVRRLQ